MDSLIAACILLLCGTCYSLGKRCDTLSNRIDIVRQHMGLDAPEPPGGE